MFRIRIKETEERVVVAPTVMRANDYNLDMALSRQVINDIEELMKMIDERES